MAKWVYKFEEGNAAMRNLLGGKGCNLAEMTILGMPIPQGFTVTTEACTEYYNCGKQITEEIQNQIFEALAWLEGLNGKKFGDTEDPLTGIRTFRRTCIHAGYDGHHPEPGIKRRSCRGICKEDGKSEICL